MPSTKVTRCLNEVFNIPPTPELYTYQIIPTPEAIQLATEYLSNIPKKKGYIFIHYQGNSSLNKKNLSHEDVRCICDYLLENDYTPIIFDWDKRSPLIDQVAIFCPDASLHMWDGGIGDAGVIAALIGNASLVCAIDSGPLHVAGATQTPSIGIWTQHHPVNFFDLSPNVIHLVPQDVKRYIKGRDRDKGQLYFETHYRFKYYKDLRLKILTEISETLDLPIPILNPMKNAQLLHSRYFGETYYKEHKDLGLDYANCGEWQQNYGNWITNSLNWKGKKILDVGCACGALTKGLRDNGCLASGCDVNEYCIRLGREKWSDVPLYICDAINLHVFDDCLFEGVHLMQTAEHIRPEHVLFVFAELNRVCQEGALLFSVHDTEELFAKQNRDGEKEDPHFDVLLAACHKEIAERGGEIISIKKISLDVKDIRPSH